MMSQPSTEEVGVLRDIRRMATYLLNKSSSNVKSNVKSLPSPLKNAPIPSLELPVPEDILAPVFAISGPTKLREQLISGFTSQIEALRSRFAHNFQQACSEILAVPGNVDTDLNIIRQTYEEFYRRRCFPIIEAQVASVMTEMSKRQCNDSRDKRPVFRSEFIPLFEKYFEMNAWPSTYHRSVLASESMMSPRQIEIWFQNRRARKNKDEDELTRDDTDEPLRLFLALVKRAKRSLSDLSDDDSGDETSDSDQPMETISNQRPPHAFPTPYSSTGVEDPARRSGEFSFPAPKWGRRPATKVEPTEQPLVDMDELTLAFESKLHVYDERIKGVKPGKKRKPRRKAWFMSTTTKPLPAPLPSLARTPCQSSSSTFPLSPPNLRLPKFGSKCPFEFSSNQFSNNPPTSPPSNSRTPSLSTSHSRSTSSSSTASSIPSLLSDESGDFARPIQLSSRCQRRCKPSPLPKRVPRHPPIPSGAASFVSQSHVYQPSFESQGPCIDPSTHPFSHLIDPQPMISTYQDPDCQSLDNLFPYNYNYANYQCLPDFGEFLNPPFFSESSDPLQNFFFDSLIPPR